MFGYNGTTITFYYDCDKMFNEVGLLSAYMAKSVIGNGSQIDEFSISDDERDIYDVCVCQALPNIFDLMLKMSSSGGFSAERVVNVGDERKTETKNDKEVELPVSVDSTTGKDINIKEGKLGRFSGKYIELNLANNGVFNDNVLSLVDASIRDCIKNGVLMEFYSVNLNPDLFRVAGDKFRTNASLLNTRLFQMKRRSLPSQNANPDAPPSSETNPEEGSAEQE